MPKMQNFFMDSRDGEVRGVNFVIIVIRDKPFLCAGPHTHEALALKTVCKITGHCRLAKELLVTDLDHLVKARGMMEFDYADCQLFVEVLGQPAPEEIITILRGSLHLVKPGWKVHLFVEC